MNPSSGTVSQFPERRFPSATVIDLHQREVVAVMSDSKTKRSRGVSRASRSPSPLPSPQGRGRTLANALAKLARQACSRDGLSTSLSPRESSPVGYCTTENHSIARSHSSES
jgi:hypothetical protein